MPKANVLSAGTKSKHTEAPWRMVGSGHIIGTDTSGGYAHGTVHVAEVGNYRDAELIPYNKGRWDADCRLIAAAPELLAALKVAQFWLDIDGRYDLQGINSAIAKAEGRE